MGRNAGFLAMYVGLAVGATAALVSVLTSVASAGARDPESASLVTPKPTHPQAE